MKLKSDSFILIADDPFMVRDTIVWLTDPIFPQYYSDLPVMAQIKELVSLTDGLEVEGIDFVDFLVYYGKYERFLDRYSESNSVCLDDYMAETTPDRYLRDAFPWEPEEYDLWDELDEMWLQECGV